MLTLQITRHYSRITGLPTQPKRRGRRRTTNPVEDAAIEGYGRMYRTSSSTAITAKANDSVHDPVRRTLVKRRLTERGARSVKVVKDALQPHHKKGKVIWATQMRAKIEADPALVNLLLSSDEVRFELNEIQGKAPCAVQNLCCGGY